MKFKVSIVCENAAFDDSLGGEVARILAELADRVGNSGPQNVVLRDINGNVVGQAVFVG